MTGTGRGMAPPPGAAFSYHRSLAPMMWAFMALVGIEAAVMHMLLAFWFPTIALIVSAISLLTLLWLVGVVRSLRRLPVLLDDDRLLWRCGALRALAVPLGQIAGLRAQWDNALVKDRATLNCALIAWPNVMIDLAAPLDYRGRKIVRITHRLDEPDAFIAALNRVRTVA